MTLNYCRNNFSAKRQEAQPPKGQMSNKERQLQRIETDKNFYNSHEWFELKNEVLKRDGYRCRYCGGSAITADHITPRSRRGADTLDNLAATCNDCNQWFRGMPFDTFEEKYQHFQKFTDEKVKKEIEAYKLATKGKSGTVRRAIRKSFTEQGKATRRTSRKYQCKSCGRTSREGKGWKNTTSCMYH